MERIWIFFSAGVYYVEKATTKIEMTRAMIAHKTQPMMSLVSVVQEKWSMYS